MLRLQIRWKHFTRILMITSKHRFGIEGRAPWTDEWMGQDTNQERERKAHRIRPTKREEYRLAHHFCKQAILPISSPIKMDTR